MRKYLYQAKTASGSAHSGYVAADSVAQARARLSAQGLVDVVVIDDELNASLREAWEGPGNESDSAIDLLVRYKPAPWRFTLHGIRKNWFQNLVFLGLVYYLSSSGRQGWALAVAILALAIALFPGWVAWQQNEVYRQFWLGHWDASERIARRLRGLWIVKNAYPAQLELDSRIASALIKKGEVIDAMRIMAPWGSSDKVPAQAVNAKLNGLYFIGRDWDSYLASMERSFAMSPDADNAKVDVAQTLARVGDDDARATALLDEVQTEGMAPLPLAFFRWGRGVIAINRGQNEAALADLAAAVGEMQKVGENPLMWGALALSTGYLAVAMARCERRDAAAAMLAGAKSIVEWYAEDRLIEGLRAERLL